LIPLPAAPTLTISTTTIIKVNLFHQLMSPMPTLVITNPSAPMIGVIVLIPPTKPASAIFNHLAPTLITTTIVANLFHLLGLAPPTLAISKRSVMPLLPTILSPSPQPHLILFLIRLLPNQLKWPLHQWYQM
jgi:hypothetical protein